MVKSTVSRKALVAITTSYESGERAGVICVTIAALISLLAILYLLLCKSYRSRRKTFNQTNLFSFTLSLVFAGLLKSVGVLVNWKWVAESGARVGAGCDFQGIVTQWGDLGIAFWTTAISIHLFTLLFLPNTSTSSKKSRIQGIIISLLGWAFITILIMIGPTVIQNQNLRKSRFIGISGKWCGISKVYKKERVYLEYFLELFAAGISTVLCLLIALHLRGRIIVSNRRWQFSMHHQASLYDHDRQDVRRLARTLLWLPILYIILLIPYASARLASFHTHVSFGVVAFMSTLNNLNGWINVIILLMLPYDTSSSPVLPQFHEKPLPPSQLYDIYGAAQPQQPPSQDSYGQQYQYEGPNHDPFVVALPQPAVIKTDHHFQSEAASGGQYWRSPEDERKGMGNFLS